MKQILLPIIAGAVLASWVVIAGLLGTPFFNAGAAYWANVIAGLALALGFGYGLGDRLGLIAGQSERTPGRLAIAAGASVTLSAWALPLLARAILDRNPDSRFAAVFFALGAIALPGTLVATVVGATTQRPAGDVTSMISRMQRTLPRRFALAMLGSVIGVALASATTLGAASERVYLFPYALGILLVVAGGVATGAAGRVIAAAVVVGLVGLIWARPSEIQRRDLLAALTDASADAGAGLYYATSELTPPEVLKGTKVEKQLRMMRTEQRNVDREISILLVIETLKRLGAMTISGDGLRQTLELYLSDEAMEPVLPFLRRIASIRSDGQKHFWISIIPQPHEDGARVTMVNEKGEPQRILFRKDFEIELHEGGTPTEKIDTLTIQPQVTHSGIVNDTTETYVVCESVALMFDAWLHAIEVENRTDQVIVRARAQAKIGGVQTQTLQTIDKRLLMKNKIAGARGQ
jgi:hypothetical protein